jgi:hypothetical protein
VLNTLVLAAGMMNGKPSISDHEGRNIHFSFHQRHIANQLDRLKHARRRGNAANSVDADETKLSLSILQSLGSESVRIAWQDDDHGKLETRVTEIAVQIILTAELQYREGTVRSYEWRVQRKAELEEEERERSAKRSGRNGNDRSGSNRPASIVCSRAPPRFSRPEQSGSTLKRFVRHRLTMRLAQRTSWNDGANGH